VQAIAAPPETRWFVFPAESAKSYVVEVVNTEGDLPSNSVGTVGVFNSDGSTAPTEAQVDCTMAPVAPSLEVNADGVRCFVRTFIPGTSTTVNKRGIYISVMATFAPSFKIRVRESTIYGRWTVNGYDFHMELQNTTSETLCAQLALLPGTGTTPPTGPAGIFTTELTIPPHGAAKHVRANGVTSGGDNKGDLRIMGCASLSSPKNFVPGAVHVSTYAYNPVTDKYLYFFTWPINNGAANSW
jgi:hypothetical protein